MNRQEKIQREIKLDANEYPSSPSWLKKYSVEAFLETCNRYPEIDSLSLRIALAKKYQKKPNQILCGNGSDELLSLIFQRFIKKDDKIITLSPTFSMYSIFTSIQDANILSYSCLDAFYFEKFIDFVAKENPKMVILCNPNNPTGHIFSPLEILSLRNAFSGILLLDEAYMDFSDQSFLPFLEKEKNIIIAKTFSKAYGLAGLRVGFVISDEDTIGELNKIKPPFNLNQFSATLAMDALEEDCICTMKAQIIEERNYLLNAFQEFSKEMKVYPSHANFIFIQTSNIPLFDILLSHKIIIRKFQELPYHFRITVGTREENQQLIDSMKEVFYANCQF